MLILHRNALDVGSTVGRTVICYSIQMANALRHVCSCTSVWRKFERGIKMPVAFGGTSEMTQVTMMKLRTKKNLTRIPYRHCRKHLEAKGGEQHSAGRGWNSDQTQAMLTGGRPTVGNIPWTCRRSLFYLATISCHAQSIFHMRGGVTNDIYHIKY